jgi:hypothetical protein
MAVGVGVAVGVGFGVAATATGWGVGWGWWPLKGSHDWPLALGSQFMPWPAKGSHADRPPLIQTSVPGPRPNTKKESSRASTSEAAAD